MGIIKKTGASLDFLNGGTLNALAYGLSHKIIYGYRKLCFRYKTDNSISIVNSSDQNK